MHDLSEKFTRRIVAVSRRCSLTATALAVTLFCSTQSQLAAQNTTHTDSTDHIRGVVINSVTHEPISRALVFSPDYSFATTTDDRGRFEFTFTPAAPQQTTTFSTGTLGPGFQNAASNRPSALMARKVGFIGPNFEQPNISRHFLPSVPTNKTLLFPSCRKLASWDTLIFLAPMVPTKCRSRFIDVLYVTSHGLPARTIVRLSTALLSKRFRFCDRRRN
jgi:hypothetical protein